MARILESPITARQNIERALRHAGLLPHLNIYAEGEDRVYATYGLEFLRATNEWPTDPGDPSGLHPGAMVSMREPGAVMPCLQVCLHPGGVAEIDLDLAAPLGGDLASLMVHGCEVFWHWITGRKSNQKRIAEWLDKRFGKESV